MSFLNVTPGNSLHKPQGPICARGPAVAKIEAFLAGKRCLVVDDEFLIALDLQEILEAAGAGSVTAVGSAIEGLEAMRGAEFDLAVLDITLGDNTDSSLAVAATLTARKIPFVFLSGMRRDVVAGTDYRYVPLVEKPYRSDLLMTAIRHVLDGTQNGDHPAGRSPA